MEHLSSNVSFLLTVVSNFCFCFLFMFLFIFVYDRSLRERERAEL